MVAVRTVRRRPRCGLPVLSGGDLVAGLSVALVLIPQSLAYAQLAGMPAVTGLYAAAVPPLVAALFTSSPHLQTGPTALTALLTFAALSGDARPGSAEWVGRAAALALVVGAARVAVGLARGGAVVYLLSEPILIGFVRGAAVLILASQLPTLLGVSSVPSGTLRPAIDALSALGDWSGAALAVAAACAATVLVTRRIHVLVPGILLAAAGSIVYVRLGGEAGSLVGPVPTGLPDVALPMSGLASAVVPGIVIALIGFSESVAIARSFAVQDRIPWDPDRDFMGQGFGNVASSLVGGFPVGGSFTRSALNRLAGATGPASGAVAALAVIAFLPFVGVVSSLPKATLASFVILAAISLLAPQEVVRLWRLSRIQFGVAAATFGLTLTLAPHVERAVVLGILLSMAVHLWREMSVHTEVNDGGNTIELRPSGVLWFGNAQAVADAIVSALGRYPDARCLRLDLARLGRIDLTAALTLERLANDIRAAGIDVEIGGIPPVARPVFDRVMPREEGSDLIELRHGILEPSLVEFESREDASTPPPRETAERP